jgi:hypothetical protein
VRFAGTGLSVSAAVIADTSVRTYLLGADADADHPDVAMATAAAVVTTVTDDVVLQSVGGAAAAVNGAARQGRAAYAAASRPGSVPGATYAVVDDTNLVPATTSAGTLLSFLPSMAAAMDRLADGNRVGHGGLQIVETTETFAAAQMGATGLSGPPGGSRPI